MAAIGRETWGTRLGVILAVSGSAIGLGNFVRFPGLAAQYEGGAFMIPYFLGFLILGLPLAWVEWSMGRYGGSRGFNSPPGIFYAVWRNPIAPYIGALSAIVPVLVFMFYVHLEAWCLGYAWQYLVGKAPLVAGGAAGPEGATSSNYIFWFSGAGANGEIFSSPAARSLLFVVISFIVNFVLIYRGVRRGIEWFNRIAMPLLVLCALIILARVLTLGAPLADHPERSVLGGLGYMWNPSTGGKSLWQALSNTQMWIDATGQVFFTLSVGFGLILTYASYVRRDDDIALSATTAAAGNEFCEVALAGLMIVPAAFIFVGPEALAATGGSGLKVGFMALPGVFEQMPAGRVFGLLFFALLFMAAVTSSLSMLQPSIAMLEEGLGLNRKASVTLLGFVTAAGAAFVGYFSAGLVALDTFDFWVGSFALYVLATVMVLVFGWVLGIRRGKEELDRGAELHIPGWVMYLIKYVSPLYLLVVFAAWVFQQPQRLRQAFWPERWGMVQWTLVFMAGVGVFVMLLVNQSVQRWRRREQEEGES
jgi:SNF family Na+-dependent transporter